MPTLNSVLLAATEKKICEQTKLTAAGCMEFLGTIDSYGYGVISITPSPKIKYTHKTHRLMWTIYFGDPGNLIVCHTCDNRKCCNPNHLFLGTAEDNIRDKVKKNRQALGPSHGISKLNEESVLEIRRLSSLGVHQKEIAAKFGVHRTTIYFIVNRRTWNHVTEEVL